MSDEARLSVVVVEDDDALRTSVKRYLLAHGCDVRAVPTIGDGRDELTASAADFALVDYQLPDGTGDELIRWALDNGRVRSACCMTAQATCRNVVAAMRAGSFDVIEKPFHMERLATIVQSRRPTAPDDLHAWRLAHAPGIIGDDTGLLDALAVVRNVADTDCSVIVYGETGTGKELVAKALHEASARRGKAFVALNCAAIPGELIESELFGHARGAFTGAERVREGFIAAADGGTLFLDEIGELPLAVQAKLLRFLQERTITPVGTEKATPVDVRIVAATHRDLEQMVEDGSFRADLYFRLSVIRVELPSLRERPGDIVPLARFFLGAANRKHGRAATGFEAAAEQALMRYPWTGNIRELQNIVERAVVMRGQGRLAENDLGLPKRGRSQSMRTTALGAPVPPMAPPVAAPAIAVSARAAEDGLSLNLRDALTGVEKQLIQQALERTGGNRAEAAALLGLNRTTLVEKMKKLTT